MSRNQRARRKEKHFKQKRDARLLRPSKSTIWNQACDRADELMDQELWSEARDVLEDVDRTHPGANCVLDRLADIYEELGDTEGLASVDSRRRSNPTLDAMMRQLTEIQSRYDDKPLSHVEPDSQVTLLLNFEIDYEPYDVPRRPQIQQWTSDGYAALQQGKGRQAEVLFKKCIEAGEDAPDILNNLAAAYAMQGRDEESQELASAVHAKWPEYFFGRIHMAMTATSEGRFGVAEQYLRPLLTKQRFHVSEFRAMAIAYIQLELEQNRLNAAQSWLDIWKSVDPDDQDVQVMQNRIKTHSLPNRLQKFLRELWS